MYTIKRNAFSLKQDINVKSDGSTLVKGDDTIDEDIKEQDDDNNSNVDKVVIKNNENESNDSNGKKEIEESDDGMEEEPTSVVRDIDDDNDNNDDHSQDNNNNTKDKSNVRLNKNMNIKLIFRPDNEWAEDEKSNSIEKDGDIKNENYYKKRRNFDLIQMIVMMNQ